MIASRNGDEGRSLPETYAPRCTPAVAELEPRAASDHARTGEEMLSLMVDRLRAAGYELSFSGLKDTVVEVLKRTHLYEKIGGEHMFPTQAIALDAIHARAHLDSDEEECPLVTVCPIDRFKAMERARTLEARR